MLSAGVLCYCCGMTGKQDLAANLRSVALGLGRVEEGVSCDKSAYKAGGKGFLFVGPERGGGVNVMLKLRESLAEARSLAEAHPEVYSVGATAWVTARFADGAGPVAVLTRWVAESYRVVGGNKADGSGRSKKRSPG